MAWKDDFRGLFHFYNKKMLERTKIGKEILAFIKQQRGARGSLLLHAEGKTLQLDWRRVRGDVMVVTNEELPKARSCEISAAEKPSFVSPVYSGEREELTKRFLRAFGFAAEPLRFFVEGAAFALEKVHEGVCVVRVGLLNWHVLVTKDAVVDVPFAAEPDLPEKLFVKAVEKGASAKLYKRTQDPKGFLNGLFEELSKALGCDIKAFHIAEKVKGARGTITLEGEGKASYAKLSIYYWREKQTHLLICAKRPSGIPLGEATFRLSACRGPEVRVFAAISERFRKALERLVGEKVREVYDCNGAILYENAQGEPRLYFCGKTYALEWRFETLEEYVKGKVSKEAIRKRLNKTILKGLRDA